MVVTENPSIENGSWCRRGFGEYEQSQPIGKDSDFSREIYDFYTNGED